MPGESNFIVNGEEAEHADFPSIVALAVDNGQVEFCTGSLIHPQIVLTAAHCTTTPIIVGSYAVYGSSDLEQECNNCYYKIIEAIQHPNYDGSLENGYNHNDLALVLLERPVDQPVITPILPALLQELALKEGGEVIFAGYGRDSMSAKGQLYFGTSTIAKFYAPNGGDSNFADHHTQEMVVGKDAPDAPNICYGDSGGPTYVNFNGIELLVGVTSRIPHDKPIECGHGAVVGLPGPHEEWINTEIDNLLAGLDKQGSKDDQETITNTLDEDPGAVVIDPVGCNYSGSSSHLQASGFLLGAIALLACTRYSLHKIYKGKSKNVIFNDI
ncbi:MAG: trypsin-like serine protease [Nanoarchaeota archaeon]